MKKYLFTVTGQWCFSQAAESFVKCFLHAFAKIMLDPFQGQAHKLQNHILSMRAALYY